MFADAGWADDRVGLGPGDFLVMYTDGITEARDATGATFGDGRLLGVLGDCAGAEAAADVADTVMTAAGRFAAVDMADDAAVLVLRVPADAGVDPIGRVVAATGVPPTGCPSPATGTAPDHRGGRHYGEAVMPTDVKHDHGERARSVDQRQSAEARRLV